MKKVILLIISSMILSGCSNSQGTSTDYVPNSNFQDLKNDEKNPENSLISNTEQYLKNLEYYSNETKQLEEISSIDKQISSLDNIITSLKINNQNFSDYMQNKNLEPKFSEGISKLLNYSTDLIAYLETTKNNIENLNNGKLSSLSNLINEGIESKEYINNEKEKEIRRFLNDYNIKSNIF